MRQQNGNIRWEKSSKVWIFARFLGIRDIIFECAHACYFTNGRHWSNVLLKLRFGVNSGADPGFQTRCMRMKGNYLSELWLATMRRPNCL